MGNRYRDLQVRYQQVPALDPDSCSSLVGTLLGNTKFQSFNSLIHQNPPLQYDSFIRQYAHLTGHVTRDMHLTPWISWAFPELSPSFNSSLALTNIPGMKPRSKYKPVHHKYHPVPTYNPEPGAKQFGTLPEPKNLEFPTNPPHINSLAFGQCVTKD